MDPSSHHWYYGAEGVAVGPHTADELRALAADGTVGPTTMLWHADLGRWTPAADVPAFAECFAAVGAGARGAGEAWRSAAPAPAFPGEAERTGAVGAPPGVPQVRPWVRFFARRTDILLMGVPMGAVMMAFGVRFEGLGGIATDALVSAVAGSILGALFLPLTGTTPGKWLLSTRVVRADGGIPDAEQSIRRELRVYVMGLGLGIPLVSFVTMVLGYAYLTHRGATAWDRAEKLVVVHEALRPGRIAVVVGLNLLIVAAAIAALGMA